MGMIFDKLLQGLPLDNESARALAHTDDASTLKALIEQAGALRDAGCGNLVTYSRKVFLPLTQLCRDVCHYCTFAQVPRKLTEPYLSIEKVVETAREAQRFGCQEALFTLGEKPEQRYQVARTALKQMGFATTLDYLAAAAEAVLKETTLMPHLNPGTLTEAELEQLRPLSLSMGIMLESASERLCERGMPHYGSPDKAPAVRLQTLERAGKLKVPLTSGILIGIGETRLERIDSLLAIRRIHETYGHIQEIIIQNFRAKPETKMASAPEPDLNELLWTIAVARLIFGAKMNIQAPPNLSPGVLPAIVDAGINDWGGVSPVSPDYVNPEAPWPHLDQLARETATAGKHLHPRLTLYPEYVRAYSEWVDPSLHQRLLQCIDAQGLPRTDGWVPGAAEPPPAIDLGRIRFDARQSLVFKVLQRAEDGEALGEDDLVHLFAARGEDFTAVAQFADTLRQEQNGDTVTFVVNRNINYTNICYFKCQFCAFSKGKLSENLRGKPYDLDKAEIQRRVIEAWDRGATEVCMQGGIHPDYTGKTYLDILSWVKEACPDMHIHAFSPLEVWQGAHTLNMELAPYLRALKAAGLGTLPGTAAEVLDDEIREIICADKINTQQWLDVMQAAHTVGFKTTATIMYGHVDHYIHWARHLMRVRALQEKTMGFTEFVPLPFVHMEAPIYLKGAARTGPTFREAILMHAVSRIVLHPLIPNIQASWVKMGHEGVRACLQAGCNDLGGTLMNESITRAAGATHGQETSPARIRTLIKTLKRQPKQRTTLYGEVPNERINVGLNALELSAIHNTPAHKYERVGGDKPRLHRNAG